MNKALIVSFLISFFASSGFALTGVVIYASADCTGIAMDSFLLSGEAVGDKARCSKVTVKKSFSYKIQGVDACISPNTTGAGSEGDRVCEFLAGLGNRSSEGEIK